MSWLTNWKYRKSITISRASGAVTNYQMKILVGKSSGATGEDVDCGGQCLDTFNDLRFTNSSGTLLDYWIESISGTTPNQLATVWVEFDSIGTSATTFYMYYGNASAESYSDGEDTFPFFDGFSSEALDTAKWTSWSLDATFSGSTITFTGSGGIYSKTTFGLNYAVRSRANLMTIYSTAYTGQVGFINNQSSHKGLNFEIYDDYHYFNGINRPISGGASYTGHIASSVGYHIYDVARLSDKSIFGVDGVNTELATYVPTGSFSAQVGRYADGGPGSCVCDWILVRQYVSSEPTFGTWSSPEAEDKELQPSSALVKIASTQQYKVAGIFSLTDFTTDYTFTSSETSVATINSSSGLATAVASGTTTITATNTYTSETITATLTVAEDTGYTIRTPLTFIGLSENTLADSTHVGWINSRFVANETDTNRFYFTDTNPYTSLLENNYWLSTDNPITCDSRGDKLSALFTAWQEIYAWGNQGLQVFQDDGVTPFVNVPGATSEVALEAIYSIKKIDNTIFALCVVDSKRAVIKFQGRSPQIISEPIASILAGMETVSDAIGDIICVGGIAIYMLNFPTANQTWAYDYKNDVWLRWGYFNTTTGNHDRFIGQHCCFVKKWNKYLIMSRLDGKIYELSRTAYDDAGNDMVSYRRTGWLDWNDISKIKRSKELAIKVKTFANDGTTDPVLMMRWRDEGYPIWSDAVEIPMNPKYFGDFIYTVTRMGSYRARQYEFRLSDGVDMALVSVQENLG